ncbi:unnamed protein product (macronuclear) [Paramecium tetraurelia]|uniref:Transmembrane protein n=1 Tax=Paramecium tetraurelia TaxID=5888 RepID=A0EIT9_PARTE|nr:uncharacterized protein GSPATT00027560001 [Paramecium tetraurelia]CAK95230.1 unnamed protein product [Paramecium tetraurelia]|eukprot:XP_001462603.1 hypothetical protein (macronuclear) [Paramecium tetraurelia strain d4-2]
MGFFCRLQRNYATIFIFSYIAQNLFQFPSAIQKLSKGVIQIHLNYFCDYEDNFLAAFHEIWIHLQFLTQAQLMSVCINFSFEKLIIAQGLPYNSLVFKFQITTSQDLVSTCVAQIYQDERKLVSSFLSLVYCHHFLFLFATINLLIRIRIKLNTSVYESFKQQAVITYEKKESNLICIILCLTYYQIDYPRLISFESLVCGVAIQFDYLQDTQFKQNQICIP